MKSYVAERGELEDDDHMFGGAQVVHEEDKRVPAQLRLNTKKCWTLNENIMC